MNLIDNDKWYSVQDIVEQGLIPILDTAYLVKRWIESGRLRGNVVGEGRGRRYFVKGEMIIEFLAKWEAGDFR